MATQFTLIETLRPFAEYCDHVEATTQGRLLPDNAIATHLHNNTAINLQLSALRAARRLYRALVTLDMPSQLRSLQMLLDVARRAEELVDSPTQSPPILPLVLSIEALDLLRAIPGEKVTGIGKAESHLLALLHHVTTPA